MEKKEKFILKQNVLIEISAIIIAITLGLIIDYKDSILLNDFQSYYISGIIYLGYSFINFLSPRRFIVTEDSLFIYYNAFLFFMKKRVKVANLKEFTIKLYAYSIIAKIIEDDGIKNRKSHFNVV